MKAAIYQGIKNVTIEEINMPECGDNDVIIKNIKAGICGTDIGAYYHGGDGAGIYPGHEFGHEMTSEVYKVGKNVSSDIKVGMNVFLNPLLSKRPDCGLSLISICDECGAFSEYVQVQDAKLHYNLFPLADNISTDESVLIEPFAVAVHGLNQGRAKVGERVVIFGAGMIGLSTVAACIGKGIKDIVVVDINEWRLEKAKEMGAIPFNAKNGDLKEYLQELYGSEQTTCIGNPAVDIDLFVDTAGASSVIPDVLSMTKRGARLVNIAIYHNEVTIHPALIFSTEVEIIGSFAYLNEDIEEAIGYLEAKTTPIEQIITHHFSLDEINKAFETAHQPDNALKVVIDY